ncbi:sirohydrochlorin chelatase [Nocardia lasii]|uniref:Sirohydrochlorin chelatase n=1 Tax=Nocardia lasii TaxID=1616107 RepID=A0ABW1JUX5_9NOCA
MYRLLAPSRGAPVVPRDGGGPALIAVAHGSRDPRSATTMAAVVARVAAARPDIAVRLAFLDLNEPALADVVDDLATAGHTEVIVVPLLLGNAFHARVDLPALLTAAAHHHPRLRLTQAPVLGPDPLLLSALADRVAAVCPMPAPCGTLPLSVVPSTGSPESFGIAVAAVGSRDAAANRRSAVVARRLADLTGCPTEICFATVEPGVEWAVERLRARGAERIAVAPWFLAPGLLTDRLVAAAPGVVHAEVIGAHPALVSVIWARYDGAVTTDLELSA